MNTEKDKEKRGMRMYRNPDGNGYNRRGSGWYGGFGCEPVPRNTGNSGGCYTGGQNGYTGHSCGGQNQNRCRPDCNPWHPDCNSCNPCNPGCWPECWPGCYVVVITGEEFMEILKRKPEETTEANLEA